MADNLVLRRLLWAFSSIVLVAGLIALPVVGDDADLAAGDRSGGGSTTTTAAGPDGDGGGGGAGDGDGGTAVAPGDTTVPDGSTPTTAAGATPADSRTAPPPKTPETFPPPSDELGAPVDPGPPVPPRPGVYRYRMTGTASDGGPEGGSSETTSQVEDQGRSGDETRLAVTTRSGGGSGGQGVTITSELSWRADGVRSRRSTFTFGDSKGECDWEPDVVEAVFPLRAGATWTSVSSCMVTGASPTPIPLKRTVNAEVVDLRRTRVAGAVVDVWAIKRVERLEGGGFAGETTALALFSPKHGLDVDITGSGQGGGRSGDYHQELLSLDPATA